MLCAVVLAACGLATVEPTPTPTPRFGADVIATQTAIANWVDTNAEPPLDVPTDPSEYALHMFVLLSMSVEFDDMYRDDSKYCNQYLYLEARMPDEEGNLPDISGANTRCLEVMADELRDRILLRVWLEKMPVPDRAGRLHSAMLFWAKLREEDVAALWRDDPETSLEKLEEAEKYLKAAMEEIERLRPGQ